MFPFCIGRLLESKRKELDSIQVFHHDDSSSSSTFKRKRPIGEIEHDRNEVSVGQNASYRLSSSDEESQPKKSRANHFVPAPVQFITSAVAAVAGWMTRTLQTWFGKPSSSRSASDSNGNDNSNDSSNNSNHPPSISSTINTLEDTAMVLQEKVPNPIRTAIKNPDFIVQEHINEPINSPNAKPLSKLAIIREKVIFFF